jgi:hypothetical protein
VISISVSVMRSHNTEAAGGAALALRNISQECQACESPRAGGGRLTQRHDRQDIGDVKVFLGLDVGRTDYHGHGLTTAGKTGYDKRLPNSEPKLRAVFDKLRAKFGTVPVIVDQPASIGALPLTVARDAGCEVAYLPGPVMRRIADLYPGEAKTDARDAHVIADAARTMPHTLRALEVADEAIAQLTVLTGFDQDLAGEATRTSNRIRGLLTRFHPSLDEMQPCDVPHRSGSTHHRERAHHPFDDRTWSAAEHQPGQGASPRRRGRQPGHRRAPGRGSRGRHPLGFFRQVRRQSTYASRTSTDTRPRRDRRPMGVAFAAA